MDGGALPSHQPLATSQGSCKGFIILAAKPPTTTLSGKAAVKLKPLKNLRPEGPSTFTPEGRVPQ